MADPTPPETGQVTSRQVEATAMVPAEIARARHAVVAQLRRWGCADTDDVALVFSELVTNAVIHAGGATHIRVTLEAEHIRIAVRDCGSAPPRTRPDRTDPGGRGLHIVDRLSARWGHSPSPDGKLVWALVPGATGTTDPPG